MTRSLSIIPGVGHFYLGLWKRGAVAWICGSLSVTTVVGAGLWPLIVIFAGSDAYGKAKEMRDDSN